MKFFKITKFNKKLLGLRKNLLDVNLVISEKTQIQKMYLKIVIENFYLLKI